MLCVVTGIALTILAASTAASADMPDPLAAVQPVPVKRAAVKPLPRIGVRKPVGEPGEFFVRETGERFRPKGFNHTVLEHGATGWHATFNESVYDPEAIDATLSAMAALGANTLRVWIWGTQQAGGYTGALDGLGLDGAYMENVVDFLTRATRHGIYIMPIIDEVPHNRYYDSVSDSADFERADHAITGYSRQFLSPGPIAAKAAAAADFVRYIKQSDPGLLACVLGWALSNEAFVNHSDGPFSLDTGTVTTANGHAYDMAVKDQRQACFDDAMVHWANQLTDAIKGVDPQALVTVGMWTSDAHARVPVNGLLPDDADPRRPPRPSVMAGAQSKLDFIDVHIYPWDGTSKVRPEAHETEAVMAGRIPAIVGEYGVFKRNTIDEARVMLREMLDQSIAMGYIGDLHWVWDLTEVPGQTWSAVEQDLGAYVMALPRP